MYSYTNGFRVSVRADGGEIVLQFVQRFPDFEENDDSFYKVNEEPVAPLTMNLDLAKELVAKLQQMTDQIEE